ncbi:MAG: GNAT family N-acetyltransferase [Cyanobacteria bacterium P01_A01_bin.135]
MPKAGPDYRIRPMSRAEVEMAVNWAAAEGWNPGLRDAECFYQADPGGFWVGLLDGEPVATVSAVRYGESFGFVGFYIVKPEYRGQGYGLQIWQAAIARLEGRTVGLDGVVAQQENYRRSGFVLAHRNARYQGILGGEMSAVDPAIASLQTIPFEQLCRYDAPFFPGGTATQPTTQRAAFLRGWLEAPHIGLGYLRDERMLGYGVIRPCQSGYKVGPLFADEEAIAERLFLALRQMALSQTPDPATPIFLDIPVVNAAAQALTARYRMTQVFETARMYLGPPPELPLERLFGVTSFELG